MFLLALPAELLNEISSYLSGSDIKNLRLVCQELSHIPLRLDRVFISANVKDIEVFQSVANHEIFRDRVREIIWDDARFQESFRDNWLPYEKGSSDHIPDVPPYDFENACRDNLREITHRRCSSNIDLPSHLVRDKEVEAQMSLYDCWRCFCQYLTQQKEVLANNLDIKAFEYGLERFPALKRITITPATHGFLFTPLYQTPMIRSLPYGFNYKIPRSWPTSESYSSAVEWKDGTKQRWRGFREALRCLAENKGSSVTEFVIDVHQLPTGITCCFFDQQCSEYDHLVALLRRPGFRRFDLALTVGLQDQDEWHSFRNRRLRLALAEASEDLEHIHLRTDVGENQEGDATEPNSGGAAGHFIPLRDIFPIERWPKLRHFGLSRFFVRQDDIISLLLALPISIRTVELSFLYFLDHGGSYRALLDEMRAALDWCTRDAAVRPRVKIGLEHLNGAEVVGRAVWLEKEVDSFLYEGP